MPTATRERRARVVPGALTAAARPLSGTQDDAPQRHQRAWQDEAWAFYHDSGPLRFAATWIANLISRARLQAARVSPGSSEPEPLTSGPAAEVMDALAGGLDGQTAMLKSLGIHLTVPGIGYLVGTDPGDGATWRIYSSKVLRLKSARTPSRAPVYELLTGERTNWRTLPPDTLVVKVWRPDEEVYWEPDSPARAALASLRELRRIGQYVDAVLASRIASAGIFIFPTEASFPTAQGKKDQPPGQHPFVTEVMEVMTTAVKQPGTAAQLVPIPVEVPYEMADGFKHLDFATQLSEHVLTMRDSALRQAAVALDVPAEILTGLGEMSHWGAWQIEESAVKVHAEPLLEVVTGALTQGYLLPTLEALGEDTDGIIAWADAANMKTRPDRSRSAVELYDRLEIDGDALRRETGMSEFDRPGTAELAVMAFKKILANPQLAALALQGLDIDLPEPPPVTVTAPGQRGPGVDTEGEDETGAQGQGPPNTREDGASPPTGTAPERAALIALETHVLRALERAGNRIRSQYRAQRSEDLADCPPEQAHCCVGGVADAAALLRDAWTRVPDCARELGLDPVWTVQCLDAYCTTLLERGFAHERSSLEAALGRVPVGVPA